MKKLLMALALLPMMVFAVETWYDASTGLTWSYWLDGGSTMKRQCPDEYGALPPGATIESVSPNPIGALEIPSSIKGHDVVAIDQNFLKRCDTITSVSIPGTVREISCYAFYECISLKEIHLSEGLELIAWKAFNRFRGEGVVLPSTLSVLFTAVLTAADVSQTVTFTGRVPTIVPTHGDEVAFNGRDKLTVFVPRGLDWDEIVSSGKWQGASVRYGDSAFSTIIFNANGGAGASMPSLQMASGRIYKLPKCTFMPPEGKMRFAGWAGSNGRRYDDEMLVFDLGNVTMTAVWDGEDEQYTGVQLWEGGPYWAECNVGATKSEEYGYYFWWGDTVGYKRNANNDGWVSVKDSTGFSFSSGNCPTSGKDNTQLRSAGYIDATGNLVAAHDAATAHIGASWRMPTHAEFLALADNCTTTWTTRNGVAGRLVTGKGAYASRSIFLPAAGDGWGTGLYDSGSDGGYWSSTPSGNPDRTWGLDFHSGDFGQDYFYRLGGEPVRPVRDPVRPFTVTFDANGGSCSTNSKVYSYGATLGTLPTPTWDGHRFSGWFTAAEGGTEVCESTKVVDSITLYAHWITSASGGVQLWEEGPYWAECNVGASRPEEYGYYFWWGDTVGYKRNGNDDGWISVTDSAEFSFDSGHCQTYDKNNSQLQSEGYIDASGSLVAVHDAATVYLGASWRMPTKADIAALNENCTTTWTTCNGVAGRLVTGKGAYASKSIFIPAAGYGYGSYLDNLGADVYYWLSAPSSDDSRRAQFQGGKGSRYYGLSIRPVRGFPK